MYICMGVDMKVPFTSYRENTFPEVNTSPFVGKTHFPIKEITNLLLMDGRYKIQSMHHLQPSTTKVHLNISYILLQSISILTTTTTTTTTTITTYY